MFSIQNFTQAENIKSTSAYLLFWHFLCQNHAETLMISMVLFSEPETLFWTIRFKVFSKIRRTGKKFSKKMCWFWQEIIENKPKFKMLASRHFEFEEKITYFWLEIIENCQFHANFMPISCLSPISCLTLFFEYDRKSTFFDA